MASTGSHLRELRELHGVSLEELAHVTRINRRFLEALEADDFAALPAGPFAKGFIRSYCEALRESPDEPLARYGAASGAARAPRREAPVPPRATRSLAPVLVSLALLAILGAALAAVTVALRPTPGPDATRGDAPAGTSGREESVAGRPSRPPTEPGPEAPTPPASDSAPRPSTTPAPGGTPAPAATAAVDVPSRTAAPGPDRVPSSAAIRSPYRLVARASDATWIRVRMEDGRTTEETIPAGDVREWISNRPFELQIGNAGGVTLELNGQALPPLGLRGVVIRRLVVPAEAR